jgi:hypothetical protein
VPVHTHRWPGVLYIFSSADFVRRDGDGNVLLDTRTAGVILESVHPSGRIRCRLTHSRTSMIPRSGFSLSR